MSRVEYWVTVQRPDGGRSHSPAQIVPRRSQLYVCSGARSVHVFSAEEKRVTAVYQFPSSVWRIEVSRGGHQLYVLCAQNGLYLVEWDEQGRLLMAPSSATTTGDLTVYQIGPGFGLLLDASICSFTVTCEVLVVALAQEEKWKVVMLPREAIKRADLFTAPSREVAFSHQYRRGSGDLQPVLRGVTLWKDGAPSAEAPCDLALEAALFTKLFGVDAAVLKSPMILCGFPDGQVVSLPLHQSAEQNSLKLLYHLEQPVVSIGAVRRDPSEPSPDGACDCVLVVGQKGLVVSVTDGDNPDAVSCVYSEYRLPAPVCCTLYSTSGVFCSTSSSLIYVTAPHTEDRAGSTTSPTMSSLHHHVPMIVALSQLPPLEDTRLVALSETGRLMLCKLHQKGAKDPQQGLSRGNAGRRIRELLSGIGAVSERFAALKTVADEKSRSLAGLNQVMSLSRALLSAQWVTCPVTCAVRVSWTRMLQKAHMTASCRLENRSDTILDRGWTLCLLIPSEPITSYSFPVLSLKPGETKEFEFPLCEEGPNSADFPITISCSLFYSLKGLAADCGNPSELYTSSSHKHGVCVPLQEQMIDLLQCLRLGPSDAQRSGLSRTFLEDAVRAMWKPSSGSDRCIAPPAAVSNQGLNYTAPLKASVRLSAALLARALKNDISGRSLCSAVLRWLLSEATEQDVHEVHGLTPDGKEFCIRVQEGSASDLSIEGSIQVVEVQILSPHLHVVASLHLAVISRFKIFLQRDQPNSDGPDINLGKIQQLFSAREPLLKEVKILRERLGADEDIISSAAAQRLLHIYRDLRDPGLLLI